MVPRLFRIEAVRREVDKVFSWELAAQDGEPFEFLPGQFNMLYAPGAGEAAISISSDPRDPRLLHTIREVGNVTRAMARLHAGANVGVRGPFGNGWPVDLCDGHDIIFVTGTIGLAPLRPLIYELLHRRERCGRIAIVYGSRGLDDVLYEQELRAWRGRFDLDVYLTVHAAPSGYRGRVGSVAALVKSIAFDGSNALAFVCRSEAMTRPAVAALGEIGVETNRVYVTLERNMKCGIGLCGHCQLGSSFLCKDGPVYRYDTIEPVFSLREY
jgi:NAD(P)H-flavin reductase